jgi:hypothetical protein
MSELRLDEKDTNAVDAAKARRKNFTETLEIEIVSQDDAL